MTGWAAPRESAGRSRGRAGSLRFLGDIALCLQFRKRHAGVESAPLIPHLIETTVRRGTASPKAVSPRYAAPCWRIEVVQLWIRGVVPLRLVRQAINVIEIVEQQRARPLDRHLDAVEEDLLAANLVRTPITSRSSATT